MDVKERLKYFYEVITTEHLLDQLPDYVAADCVLRVGEDAFPIGIDGMRRHMIDVRGTYPDFQMKIIRQFCDGDYVISEFAAQGTHQGEWLGMKPSGKKILLTGVDVDKVADGKIVEHGGAVNTFEALFDAGLIQPVP